MKLLRHLLGYSPVSLANGLVGLGSVYVFTRALGGADYGRYALMFSAMALVHTFTMTWAEAAGYRFAGKAVAENTLSDHYRSGLVLLARSLFLAAIGVGIIWQIFGDDPAYARIIPWLFAVIAVQTLGHFALEGHRASQRVARYSLTETSRVVVGFIAGATLAFYSGLGAAAPFVGLFVGGLLILFREGPWLIKQARGGRHTRGRTKAWLAYGVPIAGALVLDIVLSVSDRFLINIYLDETSVGAYAAGYGVADKPVLMLCAWAAMAASPLLMAAFETEGRDAASKAAGGMLSMILLIGLPAATGLALVAEPLAEAIVAQDLRDQAAQIIPFIAFAGLLNGLLIYFVSESFNLVQRTDLRAMLMAIPAGANIALNIILLPKFGLMGAVYATVASYALGVLVLGVVARRLMPFDLPVGQALRVGVACLAMWPVLAILPEWGSWAELFLKAGAGGAVFVITAIGLDAGGARAMLKERLTQKDTHSND